VILQVISHNRLEEGHNDGRHDQYRPCPAARGAARQASPDLLRELLGTFLNTLLSAEAGRALRHPSRQPGQRKNRIPDMVNVSQRPAEVADRAVPGHWEGDLIIGKGNHSAIGTLVERASGYTMLLHLPDGYKPQQVRDALAANIETLPDSVRHTLTWDHGPEDARLHRRQHRRRHRHLFLRPAFTLAARNQ